MNTVENNRRINGTEIFWMKIRSALDTLAVWYLYTSRIKKLINSKYNLQDD